MQSAKEHHCQFSHSSLYHSFTSCCCEETATSWSNLDSGWFAVFSAGAQQCWTLACLPPRRLERTVRGMPSCSTVVTAWHSSLARSRSSRHPSKRVPVNSSHGQLVTAQIIVTSWPCDELTMWRVDCDDLIDCYDELTVMNYIGNVVLSFVLSKLLVNLAIGPVRLLYNVISMIKSLLSRKQFSCSINIYTTISAIIRSAWILANCQIYSSVQVCSLHLWLSNCRL